MGAPVFGQPKPQGSLSVSKKTAFDKATLEAYLRHQFLLPANLQVTVEDPKPSDVPGLSQVNVTVSDGGPMRQQVEFLVSKDGAKILQGKVFDINASPFSNELRQLVTDGSPSLGAPGAPVTLVLFSDYQCQYCKEQAKTLRANLEKTYPKEARLVFKDLPIEQIHPWAKPAALIGQCVYKQNPNAFWAYHDWIFEQQGQIKPEELRAKAMDFANTRSLDSLQLTQCIEGRLTAKEVDRSIAEARGLQVTSTPTLFVNGRRMVGNVGWDQLKQVIDHELQHARKTQAASKEEACCEVKIALPANQ